MIIIGFFVTIFIGWLFLDVISLEAKFYEKLGLAFILSSGIQTLLFFEIAQQTNSTTPRLYWITSIGLLLVLFFLKKYIKPAVSKPKLQPTEPKSGLNPLGRMALVGVIVLFSITSVYSLYTPVYVTDALALYDFRAKVMQVKGTLYSMHEINNWMSYPPYTSLAHLIIRFLGSDNPHPFYTLMYLSFSLVFYAHLNRYTNRTISAVGTFAMYSSPIILWQSRQPLTNLPYAIFICVSIMYLLLAFNNRRTHFPYLLISSLCLGLTSWVRTTDPFWLVPFFVALLVLFVRKEFIFLAIFIFINISIQNIWLEHIARYSVIDIVRSSQSVITNIVSVSTSTSAVTKPDSLLTRLLKPTAGALAFFWPHFLDSVKPTIFVFAPFIFLETFWSKNRSQLILLSMITLLFLSLWVGTVFASQTFFYWKELGNAVSRLSGLFVPLMWFYIFRSPFWKQIKLLQ